MKRDVWSSIVLLLFSTFICWESIKLGLGNVEKPGPGFFPFLSSLGLGFLSIMLLFNEMSKRQPSMTDHDEIHWRNLIITFVCLVGFVSFIHKLGFNLSTFLFIGMILRTVGKKTWGLSAISAASFTLAAQIFFGVILQSQLPKGPLGYFGF